MSDGQLQFTCVAGENSSASAEGSTPRCEPNKVAYVNSKVSDKEVNLCPAFFCSEQPMIAPLTLVHEFVHLSDPDSPGPDLYAHDEGFYDISGLPGQYGLRNPDSLAMFVEVASGSASSETLAERKRVGQHILVFGSPLAQKELLSACVTLARAWIDSGIDALTGDMEDDVRRLLAKHGLTRTEVKGVLDQAKSALDAGVMLAIVKRPEDAPADLEGLPMELPELPLPAGGGPMPSREELDRWTEVVVRRALIHGRRFTVDSFGGDPWKVDAAAIATELSPIVAFLQENFYARAEQRYFVLPQ